MTVIALVAFIAAIYFLWKWRGLQAQVLADRAQRNERLRADQLERERLIEEHRKLVMDLQRQVDQLSKYKDIEDVDAHVAQVRGEISAEQLQARERVKERLAEADKTLELASKQAAQVIADAKVRAEEIGGDAYRALQEVDKLKDVAEAMANTIDGYGNRYIRPTYSVLDELAESYGFDEAGAQLKLARGRTRQLVESGKASQCDYVERNRKETAERFVVDAFNGRVDSILSGVKGSNVGTLEKQIRDAFALVNHNGKAFRDARITEEYLTARLDELKWATAARALQERDKEEQRAIKEQLREEERARKEIERALREAADEEEKLNRAMEKARGLLAKASEAERAKYEEQLADLQTKLAAAEEKNKRALSMAQQTRAGHVYVISNLGAFGEDVFKIGMTRRLEPLDRVRELGDASVPFGFDVHAMIWSEDAPGLEVSLHKVFVDHQVNKVNPRKEFFRLDLQRIRAELERRGVECSWTLAAAASEYRETLAIEERLRSGGAEAEAWRRSQEGFEAPLMEVEPG